MKLKTIIYAVATAFAFTACSNDSDSGSDLRSAVPLTVYGELAAATTTRVTYDDEGEGSFATGDIIYVSKMLIIEDINGNSAESLDEDYLNIPYKYDGSKFVPVSESDTYYFDVTNTDDVTFYACDTPIYAFEYPDRNTMDPVDTSDQTASLVNDFIFANATTNITNPKITFSFDHRMARFTLYFSSEITECILAGMGCCNKGYMTSSGDFYSIDEPGSVKCHLIDDNTAAEAYLIPGWGPVTVTVTSGGNQFSATIPDIQYLYSGHHYILNIDILDKLVISSSNSDEDDEDKDSNDNGVSIGGYTVDHETDPVVVY